MNDVHIGSNSFLSHSIVGRGSVIRNAFSSISGKAALDIDGELQYLDHIGVMIGDDCTIGSTTVVGPGIIIGRRCKIHPLTKISINIKSESTVM